MTDISSSDHENRHLSPETVADLQEGLLDARETLAAQGHLLGCSRCSDLKDRLAAVSGLLAAAGDVGPVPPDVTARVDEALAAEGTDPTTATPATATRTVTPLESDPRPPLGMRVLQVAAVLVVLLAGVGIGVSALQGGGSNESATTADSAGSAGKSAPGAGSYPVTQSGENWSQDTVVEAVPRLLAGDYPTAPDASASPGGVDSDQTRELAATEASRLAGGPPLAECVTALNDGPVTPLAVDLASWQGQPAAVVVLPTPDDPTTVDTWVVAPDCSQADAKVLYFARVARP